MKRMKIGSVCDNKVSVSGVTARTRSRGVPRVELDVYGARYAYTLSPADAHTLAIWRRPTADSHDT